MCNLCEWCVFIAQYFLSCSGYGGMRDVITEYVWFIISYLGIMVGLQIMIYLFFSDASAIKSLITAVLEGLI